MSMQGIDISSWQTGINVGSGGVPCDFVICKATQGTSYVNPDCDMENENNDYRSRMIDEARQLNERIRNATIYYAQHSDDDLLGLQITIMGSYLHVLTARIEQSEVAS